MATKTKKPLTVIEQLIPLAVKHQKADEYVSGHYEWQNGACSVGCSIRDLKKLGHLKGVDCDDHAALAKATKVPEMLWRISDNVFEGLPRGDRAAWTPRFLRACKKATDIDNAPARIMARLAERLAEDAIRDDVRDCSKLNAVLYRRRANGDDPTDKEWYAARHQAYAAWRQADAAWHQAYAARQAYAAWQQADASWQADAAWQQWQQAYAVRQQADAAWHQADTERRQADAAWHQAYAARQQWWEWCADVVCEEIVA